MSIVVEKPELIIEGGRGRADVTALIELWTYRGVLGAFVNRQIRVKYKQAALGVGWAVLQPVMGAALFAIFLGRFAHLGSEGVPYVLFALAGTVVWTFFSSALNRSIESVINEQTILRKIYFPREILPMAGVAGAIVDFVPAAATLLVACVAWGIAPTASWLAVPLLLVPLAVAAIGLGLCLSALNVYYRDVRYVLPFLLQIGLFVSPVVFSIRVVPPRWRAPYEVLNPAAAAIDGLRRSLLHGLWPSPGVTALSILWATALCWVGYLVFKRVERDFADRI